MNGKFFPSCLDIKKNNKGLTKKFFSSQAKKQEKKMYLLCISNTTFSYMVNVHGSVFY